MRQSAKTSADHLLGLRRDFKLLLLSNPNYFGTLSKTGAEKLPKVGLPNFDSHTYYEDLGCISYDPATRMLNAVVVVKQGGGYLGDACAGGSREYVRFYVDYADNGTWVDEGVASVGVYDHPFTDDLCYNVQLQISPKLRRCCDGQPVLPNVRAVLSWNAVPPPNTPNSVSVWGTHKDAHIQIMPRNDLFCYLTHHFPGLKEIADKIDFEKLPEPVKLSLAEKIESDTELPYMELVGHPSVKGDKRFAHALAMQLVKTNQPLVGIDFGKILKGIDLEKLIEEIAELKFDTEYEEIDCVSLNREMNQLHGSIVIKRDTGYATDLCHAGSQEYVAFYMDFGSSWEYMGTSSVTVHNVPGASKKLWYDVALTINLDKHRKEWCEVGKAKLRGILSWNTPPPPFDPNYVAHWGDRQECTVEVKPLPSGVTPGNIQAKLEKVGGMVVTDIAGSGLATTSAAASLGGALDSPFYGYIEFVGNIFNYVPGMKYRFRVKTPSSSEHSLVQDQDISIDTLGTITDLHLVADADGWLSYPVSPTVDVVGNLLGKWFAAERGMHTVRLEATDGTTIWADGTVSFWVDNQAPDADIVITSGFGDCGDFKAGDTLEGTYRFLDEHASGFSIYLTPGATGMSFEIDGVAVDSLSYPATLPNAGKTGTWKLHTSSTTRPCGYNVWIGGSDRTIVSSHTIGLYAYVPKGFCLKAP